MYRSHPLRRATAIASAVVSTALAASVLGAGPVDAEERGPFGWPLRPRPAVTRVFDNPDHDWLPGHRGVDLAGTGGQPVLSAGDGIVMFAGEVAGRPVISVEHPGGLRTTYEPVDPIVRIGDRVRRGTAVGTLQPGHEGCADQACLHWGARRGREYLDPRRLVLEAVIRLEPLHPW